MPPKSERLDTIQILRAFAAFSVALLHTNHEFAQLVGRGEVIYFPFDLGIGVDIFFIISGFIMARTTRGTNQIAGAVSTFLRHRVIRIVPMYWVFTSLMVLATVVASAEMENPGISLPYVVASYFFIPAMHPTAETYQPILRVGWTLNYEMFFYLIFALSLLLPRRTALTSVVVTLCAFVALGLAGVLPGGAEIYGRTIILEFAAGIALEALFGRGVLKGPGLCLALLAASVISYIALNRLGLAYYWRGIYLGIPATLFFAGAMCLRQGNLQSWWTPLLVALGNSSYILYLSHMFTIGVVKAVAKRVLPDSSVASLAAQTVVTIIIVTVAAHLIHLWFEKPVTRWLARRPSSLQSTAQAQSS